MWHLTIVTTVHGQRVPYASLVVQLPQVYSQACYTPKKVKVKSFSGGYVRDIHDNIKPILQHKPEYIILHVGTNDALKLPPNEILDKILELKTKIEEINKDCKVNISTPTYRFDNRKAGNTVNELTNMLINLNVPIVNNKNISRKHLEYKGLNLNRYGSSRLAMNLVSVIKKLWNDASYPNDFREYKYSEAKITNPNTNIYSGLEESPTDNISFIDENEESNESTSFLNKLKAMHIAIIKRLMIGLKCKFHSK